MFKYTWDFAPTLHFLGYPLRIYGLIYALCFLIGWQLIDWQVNRGGGEERDTTWLIGLSFFGVWFGGRLGHFLFYETQLFLTDPFILFRLKRGGMASHGSLALLFILLFLFSRIRKTSFIDILDRMTFPTAMGAGAVRIGNLFNSEVVGRLTDGSWGFRFPIYDYGKAQIPLRHPTQIYEALLGFSIFAALLLVERHYHKAGKDRPIGLLTGIAWLSYGVGRFVVEFWKEYQTIDPDAFFTMGQWLSSLPILFGILMLFYSRKGIAARFGS